MNKSSELSGRSFQLHFHLEVGMKASPVEKKKKNLPPLVLDWLSQHEDEKGVASARHPQLHEQED